MTQAELLSILTFAEKLQLLGNQKYALSEVDSRWNIVTYALRRHFEGKLITQTSLTLAANAPYGTAIRRINELIEHGLLVKRLRSKTGKSHSLHPTKKLILEFESYAHELKSHIGLTFGFNDGEHSIDDFYFGASYMASKTLSFPSALTHGMGFKRPLRMLVPTDPTFRFLAENTNKLNEFCGGEIQIIQRDLESMLEESVHNRQQAESAYDVIAFDFPNLGEVVAKDIVLSLNDMIDGEKYNFSDFHHAAWQSSSFDGTQYGIPIQPTSELFFYRKDLFDLYGLPNPPLTIDKVLLAAKTLHKSSPGISGIVMNYGPGTPVAHTFIQTMASMGQTLLSKVIERPARAKRNKYSDIPNINTDIGKQTLEYLLELLDFCHPCSLSCDWDMRIKTFSIGEAAMTYGWSIRASMVEASDFTKVSNKVAYSPPPHAKKGEPIAPIGGFSLAIPTNMDKERQAKAWRLIKYLTRPELLKWYAQNGNFSSPRYSTSADPEVKQVSPVIALVDKLERKGVVQKSVRPPIPQWQGLIAILGEEIHQILRRENSINNGLQKAQQRIEKMF